MSVQAAFHSTAKEEFPACCHQIKLTVQPVGLSGMPGFHEIFEFP